MSNLESLALENAHLRVRIADLVKLLERKDDMHVFELRLLRDQLTNIMKSYKLD